MKSLIFIPFIFVITFLNQNVYARSLKATADKLGQDVSQIGFGLALLGLGLGGIYLIIGKQDASTKITSTVLGIITLAVSPSIIKFIKSVA